ncbi:MAG: hypothetical protein ACR2HG_01070 [Pyrinomonadaceae bacterium]
MKPTPEEKLLNPKPGSKVAAAQKAGVDLNKLVENLPLTPTQRLKKLQEEMYRIEEDNLRDDKK